MRKGLVLSTSLRGIGAGRKAEGPGYILVVSSLRYEVFVQAVGVGHRPTLVYFGPSALSVFTSLTWG